MLPIKDINNAASFFTPFSNSCVMLCYALPGFPISGFQVDAVDQVVLNLQDEVQQTWKPGNQIVVASTDYSMHQAEEFTLLPCPHCTSRQVRIQGERCFPGLQSKTVFVSVTVCPMLTHSYHVCSWYCRYQL